MQKHLVPQVRGMLDMQRLAEDRQDPPEQKDRGGDRVARLQDLLVELRAELLEETPKHFVVSLDEVNVERVELVDGVVGDQQVGEETEALGGSSCCAVQEQHAGQVSHALRVANIWPHLSEGNESFSQ